MFRRHYKRRSTNIVFVIFRLVLSVIMFAVLLGGIYSAYKQACDSALTTAYCHKHFSGLDPLKLDPQAFFTQFLVGKIPKEWGVGRQSSKEIGSENPAEPQSSDLAFRFLLVADVHSDNVNLGKAINQAKQSYPGLKFIIGLGDYTEVGTIDELKNAKTELDSSGLRYFLIPGDHDLWDCRNRSLSPIACFREVFGPTYQSFIFANFDFLLLNNSDNYSGFDGEHLKWITDELEKARQEKVKGIFVFVHEPLFHPSSEHVMGWVEKSLKAQAGGLLFQLKDAKVIKVFAGDIHYFSEYSEPETNIPMVTIGAITSERNPQAPRFAVVSVFDDGSTKVEDVEIK